MPETKSAKAEGLMYKGHPLRRVDNLIYYGTMAEKYIIMMQVLDSKKEQDKKDVGQKSRNAGSDTAQGGSSPFPEDEGVVQKAVHREGEEKETHGDRRRSHRVGQ